MVLTWRVLVEPGRTQGIAPEGVEHDDLVVRGQALDQVRADEPGAARQENASSGNRWESQKKCRSWVTSRRIITELEIDAW